MRLVLITRDGARANNHERKCSSTCIDAHNAIYTCTLIPPPFEQCREKVSPQSIVSDARPAKKP